MSNAFPDMVKDLLLEQDPGKYFFVNQGMLTIDGVDDAQEMRDTKKAFDILLFTQVNNFLIRILEFSYSKANLI